MKTSTRGVLLLRLGLWLQVAQSMLLGSTLNDLALAFVRFAREEASNGMVAWNVDRAFRRFRHYADTMYKMEATH